MSVRGIRTILDSLAAVRAFTPENTTRIAELEAELGEARDRAQERAAVRHGIATATHALLADGWAEIVRVDGADVVVQVGENRAARVPVSRVLEVRKLS